MIRRGGNFGLLNPPVFSRADLNVPLVPPMTRIIFLQVGFCTFDSTVHYYNLKASLSQPQMLVVPDSGDPFLPIPDDLLVNLSDSRGIVDTLVENLSQVIDSIVMFMFIFIFMFTSSLLSPIFFVMSPFRLFSACIAMYDVRNPSVLLGGHKARLYAISSCGESRASKAYPVRLRKCGLSTD